LGRGVVRVVVGRGVLGMLGRWRWRLGFRKRGIRVGRWIDEEREMGVFFKRA
jgi:hypothetical protein